MLSILSWNIRQGGGSRRAAIVERLTQLSPEVIILSEFRNNEIGTYLRYQMLNAGYRYQWVTYADPQENSVIILGKIPFSDSQIYTKIDPTYSANLATVDLGGIVICGMYLPHKKKHTLFEFLHKLANDEKPVIMAGDFNTGINHIDQKGNSFWYEQEFKALVNGRMLDAYRHLHSKKEEYSWYSHQGNGYRYDHTLVSSYLGPLIQECDYLQEWRESGLSDHAPMLLKIK